MALSAGVHNYLPPTWNNYKVKVSSSLPRQHTHQSSAPPESTWAVLCRWRAEHPLPIGDPCELRSWDLQLVPSAATSCQKLQEAWGRRASQAHGRSLLWRLSKAVLNNHFSDGLVSTSNHLSLCYIQMGATFLPCLGYRIQKSQLFTTLKSKPNNLEDGGLHTETHKLGNATNTGAHNNQPQLRSEVMAPECLPENSHRQPTEEALWGSACIFQLWKCSCRTASKGREITTVL